MKRLISAVKAKVPDLIGVVSLGAIAAGVWGLWGWQVATITAATPPAAFYLYGQAVIARNHGRRP